MISRRLEDEVEIALLGKAISKLTKREQMIIRLRFGIGNREELSQNGVHVFDRCDRQVREMLFVHQAADLAEVLDVDSVLRVQVQHVVPGLLSVKSDVASNERLA